MLSVQADLVAVLNYGHFLQTAAVVAAHIAPFLRDRRELALGAPSIRSAPKTLASRR